MEYSEGHGALKPPLVVEDMVQEKGKKTKEVYPTTVISSVP